MEYLALYRKYRPKELDEVVGQSEVKKILASSIKNGTITHAYLFSGPRGTGKTTMAKILAKMVNCEHPVDGNACNECQSCLNILNSNDVIEIDAASNNGVDEIRDLREKANLVPTGSKYKVYIIDEVHMLTTQAFNALLKTLEEPPKHVIFVLATTEYYKIPLTITSRCQKFQFNKINNEDIVGRLREISNLENIEIEDNALYEIAKISDGGMRDSINFLDQLRSFSNSMITIDDVHDVCGNVSTTEIVNLFNNIREDNAEKVTLFFENMNFNGKNYGKFFEDLIGFLKDVVLFKKNVNIKYIHSDIDSVRNVGMLFNIVELFTIVDYVNKLMERLKMVSRQSVVVISNMLLLMNKLNGNNTLEEINTVKNNEVDTDKLSEEEKNIKKSENNNLDNDFTFINESNKVNLTDNIVDNSHVEHEKIVETEKIKSFKDNTFAIKNKDIIINNTFAVASKDVKVNLQNRFAKIGDYLTEKKYKVAAGVLVDTKIEVAGNNYVIFSALNDAVIDKIYKNYYICMELINLLFDGNYNFVVINLDEWNKLRDEYIKNIKKGIKYQFREFEDTLIDNKVTKDEPTVVDKLFELVGEDMVEFK